VDLYNTEEGKLSKNMESSIDEIYKKVFKFKHSLNRLRYINKNDVKLEKLLEQFDQKSINFLLDKYLGIDTLITSESGLRLGIQEKSLSYKNYKYRTFTMEYYNNRYNKEFLLKDGRILISKENGEYFNNVIDLYFTGYANEEQTKFIEWKIIKMCDFKLWLENDYLKKNKLQVKNSSGYANFVYWPYDIIPKHCIFASNL
jgi:hypothetical protein